jgi:hypothetical protein
MLSVVYVECLKKPNAEGRCAEGHFVECHYVDCHYAKCRGATLFTIFHFKQC